MSILLLRARWSLLGFLLVLGLAVGCSADGETGQAAPKAGEDEQSSAQTVVTRIVVREVGGGEAKMVPLPKSTEELVSWADIIAVGRVGKLVREVAEGGLKGPVDREGNPVKQTLVPHTYFELELEQVIRDDGTIARGETVLLRVEGTAQDGPVQGVQRVQVGEGQFMEFESNYRMPKTGERLLFLLVKARNDSYGGGNRGLLHIDGDAVRWFRHDLRPVGFAAGKTPGEFIAEIKEVADRQQQARPRAQLEEWRHFEPGSFSEMVASWDVAVIGVVSAVLPSDEFRTDTEGEPPIRTNRFQIDVEEVLVGSLDAPSIVLRTGEIFLSTLHDTAWTQPGKRSVLFLENMGLRRIRRGGSPDVDHGSEYMSVNSQGVYWVDGQNRLEPVIDDGFTSQVSGWSMQELRDAIQIAQGQIERGEVQPQPYGPNRR